MEISDRLTPKNYFKVALVIFVVVIILNIYCHNVDAIASKQVSPRFVD
jgi:hypothetical protein